jgi:hypothetical protein
MKKILSKYFLTSLVILIIINLTSCDQLKEYLDSRNDSKLSKSKIWNPKNIQQVGVKCYLKTSWRNQRLYYILTITPLLNPDTLLGNLSNLSYDSLGMFFNAGHFIDEMQDGKNLPKFTLIFMDKYNFNLLSIDINNYTRIVNKSDSAIAIQRNNNLECSRQHYIDINDWNILWRNP